MRRIVRLALAVCVGISMTSCAMKQKKVEKELKQPINCATAE